tara:strand:- start:482 stop:739 length:258 start_codon:yes stop_codon:yes gene_type:complete
MNLHIRDFYWDNFRYIDDSKVKMMIQELNESYVSKLRVCNLNINYDIINLLSTLLNISKYERLGLDDIIVILTTILDNSNTGTWE